MYLNAAFDSKTHDAPSNDQTILENMEMWS